MNVLWEDAQTSLLLAGFGKAVEPWTVPAVQDATHGAVLELDTGCGRWGSALWCRPFWRRSSEPHGENAPSACPPSATRPPAWPVDTLRDRHQWGSAVGLVVAAIPRQGPAAP